MITEHEKRKRLKSAVHKVLRRKGSSKACRVANGSALSSPWQTRRQKKYTEIGIERLKCIRCGDPASVQWQICSDGNNYRPICAACDIKLNRMVLKWMRHPHYGQLADEYEDSKNHE